MPEETKLNLDQPTKDEYSYEALFGAITPITSRMRVPKMEIYNQGLAPKNRMSCGCCGLSHIINAQNTIKAAVDKVPFKSINPFIIWQNNILHINPNAEFEGTTLQSNLDLFKKLGLITGYARVETKEEIMDSLSHQRYIYTGSQTGDWVSVRDTKIYKLRTDGKLVGHITSYFTYDNKYVYGVNSYGNSNGTIKVPWELFLNNFYSKYSISDTRDEEAFIKFRKVYS